MIRRTDKGEDETVRYVTLGCACGGKARNRTLNVTRPRPTGKTECKAKINALNVDGKFRLTTIHNIHNHGISRNKSRFFRCNREVSDSVKRVLDINDMAGSRMNKSLGSFVVGTGGFENLPVLENDCRNYIDKARHLRLGKGGVGALREYFCRMQYKNHGFFALMDLDDDERLRNVFWVDPRNRAAYQYFRDVVTFDTTYLTNRYGIPFAPFVGVNPHGQSILLGAGLISSEDTEKFVWLFQTWLQCMDELLKRDGAVKTYLVEDEIRVKEITKLVTFSVDFNEEDADAKYSCGLFQMRGILCRHIFAIFKCNGIKSLPEKYILARWRKDIKRRYTLIDSSYDAGDQRPDACRYSSLLKTYYQMITHAAGSKKHIKDVTQKLHAIIELYSEYQEPPSMTLTGFDVGCTQNDTTTVGSSKQVLSPLVVRGKCRLPSLRRASRMLKDMQKVKGKTKKTLSKPETEIGAHY
ncbi:protein FAR1-RELATED SEQUENCE 5-like [Juglans microcarpa x Juglans regia]|uniref:protein FAR1-RELATED SEQUENCE 5-like n=1 Tax=Juglans microcarpa x Juglans regia TaxID=2249226 RepID=UPI001B7F4FC2|nr:protein FAR1-RELATED SEQUENCE 5-like [Juglans microcarpa x Juglans regia]